MAEKTSRKQKFEEHVPEDVREHARAAHDEMHKSFEGIFPPEFREHRRKARKEIARGSEYALFRKLFRREMHQTVVTNMKKVGLLNPRTTAMMQEMGIDTNLAAAA